MNKFTNSEIKENFNQTHRRTASEISNLKDKYNFSNEENSNNRSNFFNSKESDRSVYDIHKLRQKIQEQAIRLQKLEQYKSLCETRILQFDSNHPLPIQEIHLKKHIQESKNFERNDNEKYKDEVFLLNQKLNILKNQLNSSENKNSFLEERLKNLNLNNKNININSSIYSSQSNFIAKNGFPLSVENIPDENLRDEYHKLYLMYNDFFTEKNIILETLKMETITNEQQKNYIEILKQTIDSFIMKNNLNNILNQLKKHINEINNSSYNQMKNIQLPSNLDFLTEITQQKMELDKNRKELVFSQALINELKREIEFLNRNNSNMITTKEKIIENLEKGITELDQAKNKLKSYENENSVLKNEIESFQKNIEKIQQELKLSHELVFKLQIELEETNRKFLEANSNKENSESLQTNIIEYKKSFEKVCSDLNEISNQKKILEEEYLKNKNQLESFIVENTKLKDEFKYLDLEKKNYLNDKDHYNKQITLLERINTELENNVKLKDEEINSMKTRYDNIIRDNYKSSSNSNLYIEHEKLKKDYDEYRIYSEKKIDDLKKKLEENINDVLNSTILKKAAFEKLKIDSHLSNTIELNEVKEIEDNSYLKNKLSLLERELYNKNELFNKINERYDILYKDYNELEAIRKKLTEDKEHSIRESNYWMKKYENDVMQKMNEIQILNLEINKFQNEIVENKEVINKINK